MTTLDASVIALAHATNETFRFTQGFTAPVNWDLSTFGAITFKCQFRRSAGDVEAVLNLSSLDGSLFVQAPDPVTRVFYLTMIAPDAVSATLMGDYVFDINVAHSGLHENIQSGTLHVDIGVTR